MSFVLTRRTFTATSLAFLSTLTRALGKDNPKLLLINSWTSVNIGDIAHPFGFIDLARKYLPHAQVILKPSNTQNGVKALLKRTYPNLRLVTTKDDFEWAKRHCDILINGSGADIIQSTVLEWVRDTGKPYGIYGVSLNADQPHVLDRVNESLFTYFRDPVSYEMAVSLGVDQRKIHHGLDSTFGVKSLSNEVRALSFLQKHNLDAGKFVCCIPRLRWSPFWTMKQGIRFDAAKDAINQKFKVHDHQALLDSVVEVARQTDLKVLVCCEDISQIQVGKELIVDKLPSDVRDRVVWRENFWLPDEAISVFRKSAGLFGNEMHSPIMCIANGIPAIVCRFREQGPKGYMWNDIGLSEWLFDHDKPEDEDKIVPAVLKMVQNPEWAKQLAEKAKMTAIHINVGLMGELNTFLRDLD